MPAHFFTQRLSLRQTIVVYAHGDVPHAGVVGVTLGVTLGVAVAVGVTVGVGVKVAVAGCVPVGTGVAVGRITRTLNSLV